MIIGVLSFACLVWFHSDRVFDERGAAARAVPAPRGSAAAGKPRDEAVDIEQAMTAILSNHEGVSQAASVAKQAVRREHQLRSAYKASAIPGRQNISHESLFTCSVMWPFLKKVFSSTSPV